MLICDVIVRFVYNCLYVWPTYLHFLKYNKRFLTLQMPSTSTTQTSATQKNTYRQLLSEAAASSDDGDDKSGGARDNVSAIIVRCNTLCHLVKMQQCPYCVCHALEVRGVICNLGMVCRQGTFCTSCDNVISSTLSSDRLDSETSGNVPFVVTRSVVSASIDVGVGHNGIASYADTSTWTRCTTQRWAYTDKSRPTSSLMLRRPSDVSTRILIRQLVTALG